MANRLLGVISAMPEELAHLADDFPAASLRPAACRSSKVILPVAEAVFVECGMGKVNAGVAAALMLDRFPCGALMFCGVAGGLDPALGVGDVVVGTRNIQYDYGAEVEAGFKTYQPGKAPMPGFDDTHGYDLPADLVERLKAAASAVTFEALPERSAQVSACHA